MVVIKIEIQTNVCYYCNYRPYHVGENECKDYSDVHVLYMLKWLRFLLSYTHRQTVIEGR